MKKIISCFIISLYIIYGTVAWAEDINDPLEDVNRAIFSANQVLDKILFKPINSVYTIIVPHIARQGVSNFFDNLSNPLYVINSMLQGEFKDAGIITRRFIVNAVAGAGGMIDAATPGDLDHPSEYHNFNETLKKYGAQDGPYFVSPVFGPTSARHLIGMIVDFLPIHYLFSTNTGINVMQVINTKNHVLPIQKHVADTAVDEYAVMRSIFYQSQQKNDMHNMNYSEIEDDVNEISAE